MHGLPGPDLPEAVRPAYRRVARWVAEAPPDLLDARRRQAELFFRRIGITFAVYGQADSTERLIPFDIIPRILSRSEWAELERGLVQRVEALNAFLADLYGPREILKAGVIPEDLIFQNPHFRLEMIGVQPPSGVYVHVAGIDLVRTGTDGFYVLEDNLRTPSGVSYMLENREMMMRLFPDMFMEHHVQPVEVYPDALRAVLRSVAPEGVNDPCVAVLTPGPYNSAYYEHSFLADKIGVELVEASDLFVRDEQVFMRTTQGAKRVDVVYRRTDDDFIDPLSFRPDSALGVPGLMSAYRAGSVTLANAVGTGVADDKAVYTYVPDIVRFYKGQEPILKNVPTFRCREPDDLAQVLDRLPELVVKEVNGSGGYGMLVGPKATLAEIEAFRARLVADPDGYIAQPTLALSTCPTLVEEGVAPRHVDLRPFVLTGAHGSEVIPGGLTRVALTAGSLVVNSSQGGGTKDTWVLDE
ncbi:MAG: circularly permuted type 2 ATP-grasp protein [Caulobacteraceae bacterium]|nr:circularly permuted type 2 ATP-grasp protein [Caulobacteraceae bacterium]